MEGSVGVRKVNNIGMLYGGSCMKRVGGKPRFLNLQEKLQAKGVNVVDLLAEMLINPDISDRIKADLIKDTVNYIYPKKKSVQIEDSNGQPITFNLQLGGK